MYYSPLRYPGGKSRLAPFMEYMLKKLGHVGGVYIEPFAGGAGIAIELLEKGLVTEIVLNDYDKGIYSFWRAALSETDRFINDIETIPWSIEEWERQHNICMNFNGKYSYELGFATFYMNRTNRSGIIKGGVIGGKKQTGIWGISARFNRKNLISRICRIAKLRNQVLLYNKDIQSFISNYLPKYEKMNAFVYFDPPYYHKGRQLYLNFFTHHDHAEIRKSIVNKVNCDWIVTYDDTTAIADLYLTEIMRRFELEYSASRRRKATELMIFRKEIDIPSNDELERNGLQLNFRPVYRNG